MYLFQDNMAVQKGPKYVVWAKKKAIVEWAPERVRLVRKFRGSREVWYLWMKHRDSRVGGGIRTGLRETPDQSFFVTPRVQDHPKVHNVSDEAGDPKPVISYPGTMGERLNRWSRSTTGNEHGAGVAIVELEA